MSTYTKTIFLSLLVTCCLIFSTKATHIVGGELEVEHVQDSTYNLRAILYFDVFWGNPNARDNEITVHIFNKATDGYMESHTLPLITIETVNYTDPDCAVASLSTERMLYELAVILDPAIYT
ncbi:MAG: gliding motility-associated C-terminal domain-containing protein, partial [Flammeovirgaceae bacterium]